MKTYSEFKKDKKHNEDNRFEVSYETLQLNAIKKNNKTLELLDTLQETIESLSGTWSLDKPMADNLIYKDKEGESFDQYEFIDNLHHWIDLNQDFLLRDSKEIYNKINNPKGRKVA